jgi:hypothetical protein
MASLPLHRVSNPPSSIDRGSLDHQSRPNSEEGADSGAFDLESASERERQADQFIARCFIAEIEAILVRIRQLYSNESERTQARLYTWQEKILEGLKTPKTTRFNYYTVGKAIETELQNLKTELAASLSVSFEASVFFLRCFMGEDLSDAPRNRWNHLAHSGTAETKSYSRKNPFQSGSLFAIGMADDLNWHAQ